MAGTSNSPGAGEAEGGVAGANGLNGVGGVQTGAAPSDPNAPGVAGFFGGDCGFGRFDWAGFGE